MHECVDVRIIHAMRDHADISKNKRLTGNVRTLGVQDALESIRALKEVKSRTIADTSNEVRRIIHELKLHLIPEIEVLFEAFDGQKFADVSEKREAAAAFNRMLGSLGLSIACPKTGEPSRFSVRAGTAAPNGMFQIEHRGAGAPCKVSLSSVTFPKVHLIPDEHDARYSYRGRQYMGKSPDQGRG